MCLPCIERNGISILSRITHYCNCLFVYLRASKGSVLGDLMRVFYIRIWVYLYAHFVRIYNSLGVNIVKNLFVRDTVVVCIKCAGMELRMHLEATLEHKRGRNANRAMHTIHTQQRKAKEGSCCRIRSVYWDVSHVSVMERRPRSRSYFIRYLAFQGSGNIRLILFIFIALQLGRTSPISIKSPKEIKP